MANFKFHVKSKNHKDTFSVIVDGVIYKNCSRGNIPLNKGQSVHIKFENTDKTHGYMNWEPTDPDDKPTYRHKLADIDHNAIVDFNKKNPNFTLSWENVNSLSWKVACIEDVSRKKDEYGGEDVTVTFGEDKP
jgi:hypothetical protein